MRRTPLTAILVGTICAIITLLVVRCARADDLPDTRAMMQRVEAILVDNGFPAHGYGADKVPAVTVEQELPGRRWGSYLPGHISLSAAQPPACLPISLAHELAHDATVRRNLIDGRHGVPVWLIRAEFERIAAIVERAVADDGPWAPNCLLRRTWP